MICPVCQRDHAMSCEVAPVEGACWFQWVVAVAAARGYVFEATSPQTVVLRRPDGSVAMIAHRGEG
jgi:hypothetical protein